MRNACFRWIIFSALAATLGCRGPSTDWNSTWKLSPAKGNFQGPIYSISISADGEYCFNDNGRLDIPFRCDGKDRPIGRNRTRACAKGSPTVLDLVLKENGAKTTVTHWELFRYDRSDRGLANLGFQWRCQAVHEMGFQADHDY